MNAISRTNKWTNGRHGLRLALSGMLGALALPACANHVSVPAEIATCPCAAGAVCCSSGVCAADATGCDAATAALSSSVEGEWQGYFENFTLNTDDSLTISIVVADDGKMSGHVTMGQAAAPPAPTDPDAVWPPDLKLTWAGFNTIPTPYVPGFAYQAQNIRWEAQRLRFDIDQYEPWGAWCQLQSPYQNPDASYSCLPGSQLSAVGSFPDQQCFAGAPGDPGTPVSCAKGFLCSTCSCAATGCTYAPAPAYSFDIALRDGIGDGTTSMTPSPIRLNQTSQN